MLFVTDTFTSPTAWAGTVTFKVVEVKELTVAAVPPKATVVAALKFVPVITAVVPLAVVPQAQVGKLMPVIVGAIDA